MKFVESIRTIFQISASIDSNFKADDKKHVEIIKLKEWQKKDEKDKQEKEQSWMQILAICIACLATLTYGCHFSWTSPSIPKLLDNKEYNITSDEASYFTMISSFAFILSTIATIFYSEKIGRKSVLLLIAIPHLLAWILIATATSVYAFYLARFLAGTAEGILFSAAPMYIGEISSPRVRGTFGNVFTWAIYAGELLINLVGSYWSVRETALILMPFPVIFAVCFAFMPESPYFYLMHKREEAAHKSLQRLKRKKDVEKELKVIKEAVDRQMLESGGWKDLLKIKSNRRSLICGVFLRFSQLFSGLAPSLMYAQSFFKVSGLSPQMTAIAIAAFLTILNAFSGLLVDYISRKKGYVASLFISGVCLIVNAIYAFIEQHQPHLIDDIGTYEWIPLLSMAIYNLSAAFGITILPNLMLSEIFATSIKTKALCIVNIVLAILEMLTGKIFYDMNSYIGLYSPLLLFACCCMVSTVAAFYIVPETNGKTLEEIQELFRN